MGCCLSKNEPSPPAKTTNQISKPQPIVHQTPETFTALLENNSKPTVEPPKSEEKPAKQDEKGPKQKKEIFVIQHRKSNDRRPEPKPLSDSDISDPYTDTTTNNSSDNNLHSPLQTTTKPKKPAVGGNILAAAAANGQAVRTSSCTKEELDAILIQCGRLSRSSSGKGNSVGVSSENRRKYSGSKRSHDFDKEIGDLSIEFNCDADDERHRRRQSRGSSGSRRRTPSRSRERDQLQQNRSGSRERGGSGGGGRRVSRSPGRRSDSPIGNGSSSSNSGTSSNNNKPGKMVSIPATVTHLSSMDKNNNGGGSNDGVKRVLVKRNVGGDVGSNGIVSSRNAASPSRRSRSPTARTKFGDENNNNQQHQTLSLSRNSSRKAEHSPYRRTPLNEIDTNSLPFQPLASKANKTQQLMKNKEIEEEVLKLPLNNTAQPQLANNGKGAVQATHHRRSRSRGSEGIEMDYWRVDDHQPPQIITENKGGEQQLKSNNYDDQLQLSGSDSLKLPQTIVRSRSLRRSRDLDINLDSLLNPNPVDDYNSLLLQDIQKFHHNKNSANTNPNANTPTSNNNTNPNLTLPACVTKACSILEAVADLNSSTTSGFSSGFTDNKKQRSPVPDLCSRKDGNNYSFTSSNNNPVSVGKKKFDGITESQANVGGDDLMEPSFHKYVTVRNRDSRGGGDMEQEESSGSNSYIGSGGQHWFSNSSKEPNSADSTDCWTSRSSSNTRGDDKLSPVGFNRLALTERNDEESRMKLAKRGPGYTSMCAVAGASI